MEITREQWDEILPDADLDDEDFDLRYPGRGMYGRSCFGVVGDLNTFARLILAVQEVCGRDVAIDLADAAHHDGMGRDTIYYFPGWTVQPEPDRAAPS